jgi:O-antigen ligase
MTVAGLDVSLADARRLVLPRIADGLAVAVAVFLPWSTSAVGILVALWLVACLPMLDVTALRRELASAAGALPVLLAVLAVVGISWADATWAERLHGVEPFLRLLMIPILFVQFRRSANGTWVGAGFLASVTVLLATSLAMVALGIQRGPYPGVPVKDYVSQSGMFVLCGFVLADIAIDRLRAGRRGAAAASAALALLLFMDVAYVVSSRTTLVVIPVLYAVWGLHRFSGRRLAGFLLAGLAAAAAVWIAAPKVGERLAQIPAEIASSRATGAVTSSGSRLGFWQNSLTALLEAPVFGHGTGTIATTFSRLADPGTGSTATNPHNEILAVGIQLGGVGIAVLLAMWAVHWRMFLHPGPAAWIGLAAVTQNIVGSLFNSHLMDFTQSWLYVFAVGVHGGMLLQKAATTRPDAVMRPAPDLSSVSLSGPPSEATHGSTASLRASSPRGESSLRSSSR